MKNLDTLIEAFALAKPEIGNSKLRLTCEGKEAERIKSQVDRLGLRDDVEFIGEI